MLLGMIYTTIVWWALWQRKSHLRFVCTPKYFEISSFLSQPDLMSSLSLGLTAARQGAAALPDEPRPARGGGPHYAVVTPGANPPMFEGMMDTVTLADGLSLQRVDVRDLQGAATQTQLPAGIHIALTVGGRADVSYGGYRLLLGPRADGRACGAVVALTQPAAFTRQSRRGDTERSVCLTLTHEWLQVRLGDTLPRCRSFARQHLAA